MENAANAPSESVFPVIDILHGHKDAFARACLALAPQHATSEEAPYVALEFIERIVEEPHDVYRVELLSGFRNAMSRVAMHFSDAQNSLPLEIPADKGMYRPRMTVQDFIDGAWALIGAVKTNPTRELYEVHNLIEALRPKETLAGAL